MPMDGAIAQKRIANLFRYAKNDIKMTIYTFTNKELAKALIFAAKRGVKVTIIADRKEAKFKYSVIPHLALIKNIKVKLLSGKAYKDGDRAKMHVKMSIIDDKYLIIGSANYSYSAFFKNYEYILIEKDKSSIEAFKNFFNLLLPLSIPFKYAFIK